MSGRFPEAANVEEFWGNLRSGVDMVTANDRRWPRDFAGLPTRKGILKTPLDEFDADFFGIHRKQAERLDPRLRQLLEVTWESIFDSGVNPVELRGRQVGVYVGISSQETFEAARASAETITGYDVTGSTSCIFPNRLSFAFDFHGPSVALDTYCSSSLFAMHLATKAILHGECEGAIVAGVNIYVNPLVSLQAQAIGVLSPDGKCKAFDASGNGYAQSEAIVAVYITKRSLAKRCYATILNTATNTDGYKENGLTYPSGDLQEQLMRRTYAEAGILPEDVYYVEAHGTGTAAGDVQELQAITAVFCQNRPITAPPLLIGSTKSNMGHAEPASSLCCVIKVLLSIQHGQIPGNLHYVTPNPAVPALVDGRLKVIDSLTPVTGGLFGVCASGIGGTNVHVILRGQRTHAKEFKIGLPVLIPLSSRTPEGVELALRKIEQDPEIGTVQLLSAIHELPIKDHNFRGFALLDTHQSFSSVSHAVEVDRPLWVILPGMGTQWAGMGRDIMQIDLIRKSLEISASILKPFDLDLMDIVTNLDEVGFRRFSNVALTAVGIALVDFFKSLDLAPAAYIGHSTGEILCAYLDGCWTHEQALLCQYYRQSLLNELEGDCAMASVGLTWEQAMSQCPEGIYPACHNAVDNVTLSGREVELVQFVQELKSTGVFAKMVPTGGVGFHSPYISPLLPRFERLLRQTIGNNEKLRSNKWVSTVFLDDELDTPLAKYSSVEYFLHQFLSPVQFHSAVKKIPSNAVILELGSHSIFQNVLKRSLPASVTLIPTMQRNADHNVRRLYSAVGSLFVNGFQPKLSALWPQAENLDTLVTNLRLSISSLVQWDHSQKHALLDYLHKSRAQHVTKISILEKEWEFLKGHKIDGRILFPATGYLILAWKAIASLLNRAWKSLPIKFENVILHRATVLTTTGIFEFAVNIFEITGEFQVCESDVVVASGRLEILQNEENLLENFSKYTDLALKSEDVYKDFRLRGYEYTGEFRGILSSSLSGEEATLQWQPELIALLDTLLQVSLVSTPLSSACIHLPTRLKRIVINPAEFDILKFRGVLNVQYLPKTNSVTTSGVEIYGARFSSVPRRKQEVHHLSLQRWEFVPYIDRDDFLTRPAHDAIKVCVDIVLENVVSKRLCVKEFCASADLSIVKEVAEVVKLTPGRESLISDSDVQLLILHGLTNVEEIRNAALQINGFVLIILKNLTTNSEILEILNPIFGQLNIVATKFTNDGYYYLLRQDVDHAIPEIVIQVSNTNYEWIDLLQEALSKGSLTSQIWLTSNDPESGLVGFVNCLRKEGGHLIRCLISPESQVTDDLKVCDLVMNVFNGGNVGSYRSFTLPDTAKTTPAHAYLDVLNKGDLSSLAWVEAPKLEHVLNRTQISVHYAPLNFRDIMLATGKLSPDALPGDIGREALGLEFSGIDPQGNRVMGAVPSKGLSTHVQADPNIMWKVPDKWTLAEASTVPMTYATAYYALIMRGNLQHGESVLITSGTGGVGLAAIAIALSLNCQIYTTVGSYEKKMWLANTFPQIKEDHILNSQGTEFASEILEFTDHHGVDVVLNSLAEEKLQAALSAVANGGRFLEIGKSDLSQNTPLGMEVFLKNIAFHGILLDSLYSDSYKSVLQKQRLQNLIFDGIQSGVVQPLPISIFDYAQAHEAFRFMASGKHIGKVVLRVRSNDDTLLFKAIPTTYFDPRKMYILIGGLGGFGLAVTTWLISRGAQNVALVGRSGVTSGYQQLQISRWQKSGVNVLVTKVNLQNPKDCEAYLQECESMATVGGIFNLAMVLKDGIFENQNSNNFEDVVTPKFGLTQNLDHASRKYCPHLDYFITFSSVSSVYGNAGQTNYAFGNCAMERICAQRRKDGFPAQAIAWGPIGDVGVVHEEMGGAIAICDPQPLASCLNVLNTFLHPSFQDKNGIVSSVQLLKHDAEVTQQEPQFTTLTQRIAQIIGLSAEAFEAKKDATLAELGLDSLMFLEAKQVLTEFGKVEDLTSSKIRRLCWNNLQELEFGNLNNAEAKKK